MKIFYCLFLTASLKLGRAQAQQSDYYAKARDLYRGAAAKTKCADRAAVLNQYADWNQCMVDKLAGRSVSCAISITTPIPPCDGDAMASGNSGGASGQSTSGAGGAQAANNAVEAIGNGIMTIIQNGQAKRNSITSALTTSFSQNLYNNKINLNYYHSQVCSMCQGKGWTKEGDFSAIPCAGCNGLGKTWVANNYFQTATKDGDPQRPAMSALVAYLNGCQSEHAIYDYSLDGYKGSASLKVTNDFYLREGFLVVAISYKFSFLRPNGDYDTYASLNNWLNDTKVIPLNELLGVSVIPPNYQTFGQNSVKSSQHFALSAANGDNVEFASADYTLIDKLTDLINKAKLEQSN